jgi:hypothetical protein
MKTVRIVCIIILVFSCNNEEMIINPFVYTQQYLVFLVRGDSISAGAGETAGPTTSTGIVYEWDQTNSVLIDRATELLLLLAVYLVLRYFLTVRGPIHIGHHTMTTPGLLFRVAQDLLYTQTQLHRLRLV